MLPQILTDKEMLSLHIQDVRKMGMEAYKENKSYKLCTEDNRLVEYIEAICIYSSFANDLLRNILYGAWWEGYRNKQYE